MTRISFLSLVRRPKEVVEKVLIEVVHTDLTRVSGRIARCEVAADLWAPFDGSCSGSAEGEWEAAQHCGDNPARMSFGQQMACGFPFFVADLAGSNFDFIDRQPGDVVWPHRHLKFSVGLCCDSHGADRAGVLQPRPVFATEVAHGL